MFGPARARRGFMEHFAVTLPNETRRLPNRLFRQRDVFSSKFKFTSGNDSACFIWFNGCFELWRWQHQFQIFHVELLSRIKCVVIVCYIFMHEVQIDVLRFLVFTPAVLISVSSIKNSLNVISIENTIFMLFSSIRRNIHFLYADRTRLEARVIPTQEKSWKEVRWSNM